MKNLIVIGLLILLVSCNSLSKKSKTYNEIVKAELSTGIRKDTIFLNFTFGMTEKQFNEKLIELINDSILYLDPSNSDYATYNLTVDEYQSFKCTFKPEYFNGKLWELGVSAKSSEFSSSSICTLSIQTFYLNKYGSPSIEEPGYLDKTIENYIWIKGNREIKIMQGYSDARIFYTDLSIKEIKEKQDSIIKQESEKKSNKVI